MSKSRIHILPPELKNQIAAGEVVERPSSVVKELAENSIDADATRVDVFVERGGQGLIVVQDDGMGMNAEDLPLAVSRHATSKITSFEDLSRIGSFGFRGEALPSISSVSDFLVQSIPRDEAEGWFLHVNAGRIVDQGPTALASGTRIEVRDLFAVTPARLKFLKTEATETRRCQEIMERLALANLHCGFTFRTSSRTVFSFPPDQDLRHRLETLWPPKIHRSLVEFDYGSEGYRARGLAGDPQEAQGRGDRMIFFVNGRPVQDRTLVSAVRQAYAGRLLSREFPQVVLFLDVPPAEVDVNVHPAKAEVRFQDESRVFSVVRRAVLQGLEAAGTPLARVHDEDRPGFREQTPGYEAPGMATYKHSTYREFQAASEQELPLDVRPTSAPRTGRLREEPRLPSRGESDNRMAAPQRSDRQPVRDHEDAGDYLGQILGTYLALKLPGGELALLDQHAAHERVLFERSRRAGTRGDSRPLALPLEMRLHASECHELERLWNSLGELGFQLETPQEGLVLVKSVPSSLTPGRAREFLQGALTSQSSSLKDLWIMLACKTAIKAGQTLARDEALALIDAWMQTADRKYCPHGRPVLVSWSESDLERLFKRKK